MREVWAALSPSAFICDTLASEGGERIAGRGECPVHSEGLAPLHLGLGSAVKLQRPEMSLDSWIQAAFIFQWLGHWRVQLGPKIIH